MPINCEACKEQKLPEYVPYAVWLKEKECHQKQVTGLVATIILLFTLAFSYISYDRYRDGTTANKTYVAETDDNGIATVVEGDIDYDD